MASQPHGGVNSRANAGADSGPDFSADSGEHSRVEGHARIKGVFSREGSRKLGAGASSIRKALSKSYWYCQELDDGSFESQAIGQNHIPTGDIVAIERDEFLKHYTPEPAMYFSLVYPSMMELELNIKRGDRFRTGEKYERAKGEYDKALWIDEDNIRATFGLALTLLGMGNTVKANLVFERLVKLDAAFRPEHKHLFNELGIKLRKHDLYTQAIAYYSRALELTNDDENLFFNMGRVYFHCDKHKKCMDFTMQAVELNPLLEPAVKLLQWIMARGLVAGPDLDRLAAFLEQLGRTPDPAVEDLASFEEADLDTFLDEYEEFLMVARQEDAALAVAAQEAGAGTAAGREAEETVSETAMAAEYETADGVPGNILEDVAGAAEAASRVGQVSRETPGHSAARNGTAADAPASRARRGESDSVFSAGVGVSLEQDYGPESRTTDGAADRTADRTAGQAMGQNRGLSGASVQQGVTMTHTRTGETIVTKDLGSPLARAAAAQRQPGSGERAASPRPSHLARGDGKGVGFTLEPDDFDALPPIKNAPIPGSGPVPEEDPEAVMARRVNRLTAELSELLRGRPSDLEPLLATMEAALTRQQAERTVSASPPLPAPSAAPEEVHAGDTPDEPADPREAPTLRRSRLMMGRSIPPKKV